MNCLLCDSDKTEIKFVKNGYRILHCLNCDHLFTDLIITPEKVNQIYSDDYFFKGGAGYDDYTLEKDMLIKRGEYYADKISKYTVAGKALDVGSAAGFLLKGFENKGWEGTGIEPNRSMVAYGNKVMGLNIKEGTIENITLTDKYDLIIMIQVIAHINDLKKSFRNIFNCLKKGGHILIETWNKDSLTAQLFGKRWHEYSPPGTLNFFSKRSLNQLIGSHGFSLVKSGHPKKNIYSKHAKSLIRHTFPKPKRLKWLPGISSLIPGNMILPYPAEDLIWALYKKTK